MLRVAAATLIFRFAWFCPLFIFAADDIDADALLSLMLFRFAAAMMLPRAALRLRLYASDVDMPIALR